MNIAFVPVRCGSQSIPLKNIKLFCGKPLVYWNLKALEDSSTINKIYVATDCKKISLIVESFNFSKVQIYHREKKNASAISSTESVIIEFLMREKFHDEDLFFLVQATSPLTQTKDIDSALALFQKKRADSLLTCVRTKKFFWNNDGTPFNYNYQNRPRRQDFDGLLMENGAFYISKIKNIKKYKNRLSGNIAIYEMDNFKAIELDEEDDWLIAEKFMYKHILKQIKCNEVKLFLSDVDGTLTDGGMYYDVYGNELKKFNTHDGKGFELIKKAGIKTGLITSEDTQIASNRAKKLKVDYLFQGIEYKGKLEVVKKICEKENIKLEEVAYIGDDINCKELLMNVGTASCPYDSLDELKEIPGIIKLNKKGGYGAVREFAEIILKNIKR